VYLTQLPFCTCDSANWGRLHTNYFVQQSY